MLCDNWLYKNQINEKYIRSLKIAYDNGEISKEDYEFWKEYNETVLTAAWYQNQHFMTEFNKAFGEQGEIAVDIITVLLSEGQTSPIIASKIISRAKAAAAIGRPLSHADAIALRAQLIAQEIAGGHAYTKHVVQGEFSGLGIRTRKQFAEHIENVISKPSDIRYTTDGRIYYIQESTYTVVIRNPKIEGTAFRPPTTEAWNKYISELPTRNKPYD